MAVIQREDGLRLKGQLDPKGHLEIARQLGEATIGDFTPFVFNEEEVEHAGSYEVGRG